MEIKLPIMYVSCAVGPIKILRDANGRSVGKANSKLDAAFIATRVNTHDDLVAALKLISENTIDIDSRRTALDALAWIQKIVQQS